MRFERGYQKAREKVDKGSQYIRNCFNCAYYDREHEKDKHEKCVNDEVTQYDLIVDGNNVYCTLWTPYTENLSENKLFGTKKTGRRILEQLEVAYEDKEKVTETGKRYSKKRRR